MGQLDDIEAKLSHIMGYFDGLGHRLKDIERDIETIKKLTDTIDSTVDDIQATVNEQHGWINEMSDMQNEHDDTLTDIEKNVELLVKSSTDEQEEEVA